MTDIAGANTSRTTMFVGLCVLVLGVLLIMWFVGTKPILQKTFQYSTSDTVLTEVVAIRFARRALEDYQCDWELLEPVADNRAQGKEQYILRGVASNRGRIRFCGDVSIQGKVGRLCVNVSIEISDGKCICEVVPPK